MKILITNYTFDASAKTVTFNDYGSIVLDGVLLIANVTDNIIIYNFASPAKGGSVATNVLTLTYDTTSMSDTDDLLIYYDDPAATQEITVSSLPLPAGAATAAAQLPDGHNVTVDNVGGVEVVQATAADLNATVVGTVTANLGATDNAVLDQIELNQDSQTTVLGTIDADTGAIKTAVETINNAISGSEMQVDVVTLPLTKEDGLIKSVITDTTVDSTADLIFDASADTDAVELTITNSTTTVLYVGEDASVTTADFMYYIPPKQTIVIKHAGNAGTTEDLYGIRDAGNSGLCKVYSRKYK